MVGCVSKGPEMTHSSHTIMPDLTARRFCVRIVISGLLIISIAACDDLRAYTQYEDLSAARMSGAVERGWIPEWLPEQAIHIHEHHDLDTNVQAISFRIKSESEFEWPSICARAERPTAPRLKTKLFPKSVHKLKDVRNCRNHFAARGEDGAIHIWTVR
jgi:hypothetical protein